MISPGPLGPVGLSLKDPGVTSWELGAINGVTETVYIPVAHVGSSDVLRPQHVAC